jgi:hypothetical protein
VRARIEAYFAYIKEDAMILLLKEKDGIEVAPYNVIGSSVRVVDFIRRKTVKPLMKSFLRVPVQLYEYILLYLQQVIEFFGI